MVFMPVPVNLGQWGNGQSGQSGQSTFRHPYCNSVRDWKILVVNVASSKQGVSVRICDAYVTVESIMLLNKSVRALQGHQCQAWGSASGLAAFPRQSTQASTSYTTRKSQLNAVVTTAAPASAASVVSVASTYLNEHKDLHALVEPKQFRSDLGDRLGLVARAELKEGQVTFAGCGHGATED